VASAVSASASATASASALASVAGIQTEVSALETRVVTLETEVGTLNSDVSTLQYNTTGITYLTGTTYIENNVKLSPTSNLDSSNISTTFIVPNNLERIISIGSATQSDTIILNGTVSMPLNDLFNGFTRVNNGFYSQLPF
jgi:hypothetical protein